MGEIFEQRQPASALEWTGERLVSGVGGQIEIEHLHRYMLARDFCRGLDVLDVASGEGYGTALLADVARSAAGVEVSPAAAGHAAAQYSRPNLRYLQGDARNIPLADQSVDVVVSFETIEHFYEHDDFLAEVRRVLRPGGRFLVSSPDRDVYSPPGSPANPYHKRELSRPEFVALLARFFAHARLLCQRPMLGSVLLADDGDPSPVVTFEKRGAGFFERSDGVSRPPYLIALASDAALPPLPNSLYVADGEIGPLIARAAAHDVAQEVLAEALRRAEGAEAALHAERAAAADAATQLEAARAAAAGAASHAAAVTQQRDEALAAAAQAASAALQQDLDAALAGLAAAAEARTTLQDELRQACMQRDAARLALRRAASSAGNPSASRTAAAAREIEGLSRRTIEAEEAAQHWMARYYALRARLDGILHRSGLFGLSRLVPRTLRRSVLARLFPGR